MVKRIILFSIMILAVSSAFALKITDVSFDRDDYMSGDDMIVRIKVSNEKSVNDFAYIRVIYKDTILKQDAVSFLIRPLSNVERTISLKAPVLDDNSNINFEFKLYSMSGINVDSRIKTVSVLTPYSLFETGIVPVSEDVFPGETAVMQLEVSNLGNLNDYYTVYVEGWEREFIALQKTKLELPPNSHSSVRISFSIPYRMVPKQYNPIIKVCSSRGVCKTNEFSINVLEYSNSVISGQDNMTFAIGGEKSYKIDVYNDGNVKRDYLVSVPEDMKDIIKTSPAEFSLNPGEGRTIELSINSQLFEEGAYSVDVKITNKDEEINKQFAFHITGSAIGFGGDISGAIIAVILVAGVSSYVFWRYQVFTKKKKYEYWK
ncbi:MAG: hypothetical protein PHW96_02930 [Candidatus Nanoarchaeia archaeon]|nr:hypothetical protein [Candidatus Nanoarchaeia archaeon]